MEQIEQTMAGGGEDGTSRLPVPWDPGAMRCPQNPSSAATGASRREEAEMQVHVSRRPPVAAAGPLATEVCDRHFPCPRCSEEVMTGALRSLTPGAVSNEPATENP